MHVDGTPIGEGVFFIAEAGVNHNGDVGMAEDLIAASADAGADAVKFQTFSAERVTTADAEKAGYQQERSGSEETQQAMLRRLELSKGDHERLKSTAEEHGISFLSTPFDVQSADLLDELGVAAFKVGSGDLTNHPLLEHLAGFGRPMIVSTGMATMAEVEEGAAAIREANADVDVAFLHCTSSYPTPMEHVNLRAMEAMMDTMDCPVGYSDHTLEVETPGFATAAGAVVVEKHVTLDRSLDGPDHRASLEPDDLERAVRIARLGSTARGSGVKEPTMDAENEVAARKSLHAAERIWAGERFTRENVSIVRPETGLPPGELDSVLGRQATVDLEVDDPITEDAVGGPPPE